MRSDLNFIFAILIGGLFFADAATSNLIAADEAPAAKKGKKKGANADGAESPPAARGSQTGEGDDVPIQFIDQTTRAAFISRGKEPGPSIARGKLVSNLIPIYPSNASCRKIDLVFALPEGGPSGDAHNGADIPASWDESVLAIADGTVVAKFTGENGARGLEIIIRHAPEDTGLPVWVYSGYAHFRSLPKIEVGQRVHMGDILGPNGKSGVPGKNREPHLHFSASFSSSHRYAVVQNASVVIPVDGYHADPVALFRNKMPIDTASMRALSENERRIPIAHKLTTGEIVPSDAKIIWPFACRRS